MAANIEICYIRKETRGRETAVHERYIAQINNSSGVKVVAQTNEFIISRPIAFLWLGDTECLKERKLLDQEYQEMIQSLLLAGWEVLTADQEGIVTSLRRQPRGNVANSGTAYPFDFGQNKNSSISTTSVSNATSPTDLLKQLASLRDAGILTEQEFQAKKRKILRRI